MILSLNIIGTLQSGLEHIEIFKIYLKSKISTYLIAINEMNKFKVYFSNNYFHVCAKKYIFYLHISVQIQHRI